MKPNLDEAHLAVQNARNALRENRRSDARQWAERAASLAPQMEDPWLILAAIASPQVSLQYIQKALHINPNSPRARRGMEWAMQRLQQEEEPHPELGETRRNLTSRLPRTSGAPAAPAPSGSVAPSKARFAVPILLVGIGLVVCAAAGLSAMRSPAVASIIHQTAPTEGPSWAEVSIPKPTYAPEPELAQVIQPTEPIETSPTPPEAAAEDTAVPTNEPTEIATEPPTEMPTQELLPTAEPTWSGSLSLTYEQETPTAEAAAPTSVPSYSSGGGEHWIDVNLSQQMVYAYEGDSVINSFLVSTGTWLHPTVTGRYHIYVKLRYTDMSGADYYLPNVPYTMYFFQGYGLHGTYWHHNFGTPMSHGCVNLSIPDAEWLYNFASVGTLVNVHY